MYLSELPGKHHGCREAAIEGIRIIAGAAVSWRRHIVVFDVHWLVNAGYHINCAPSFKGVYTSNELAALHSNMPYEYPAIGAWRSDRRDRNGAWHSDPRSRRDNARARVRTLVPMRYMNGDQHFKVVSIAAWCAWHVLDDSRGFGEAVRPRSRRAPDGGCLCERIGCRNALTTTQSESRSTASSREFYRQVDLRVVDLWKAGDFKTFCAMLRVCGALPLARAHARHRNAARHASDGTRIRQARSRS